MADLLSRLKKTSYYRNLAVDPQKQAQFLQDFQRLSLVEQAELVQDEENIEKGAKGAEARMKFYADGGREKILLT